MDAASAHAKLHNGGHHLARVEDLIETTLGAPDNQATLASRFDAARGRHSVFVAAAPDLSEFSQAVELGVGDVVNNLRGALDHVARQLALRYRRAPPRPRDVQFPICRRGDTCRSPAFLDPADWTLLHEWQPCKGANGRPDNFSGNYVHQRELLAELKNADKHQDLTEIVLTSHQMSITPPISFGFGDLERPDFIDRCGLGTEVLRVRAPTWPREGQASVGSARPTELLGSHRAAVPTLRRLEQYVADVLGVIDTL
ncbi:hypothetical protein [Flexivirga alba]|uniref:N-formylglutamate amidohydrolase n=1 Tax=Flexivirga alba TaxID=702742 RepID=A0ABW2ADC6_9MICO